MGHDASKVHVTPVIRMEVLCRRGPRWTGEGIGHEECVKGGGPHSPVKGVQNGAALGTKVNWRPATPSGPPGRVLGTFSRSPSVHLLPFSIKWRPPPSLCRRTQSKTGGPGRSPGKKLVTWIQSWLFPQRSEHQDPNVDGDRGVDPPCSHGAAVKTFATDDRRGGQLEGCRREASLGAAAGPWAGGEPAILVGDRVRSSG